MSTEQRQTQAPQLQHTRNAVDAGTCSFSKYITSGKVIRKGVRRKQETEHRGTSRQHNKQASKHTTHKPADLRHSHCCDGARGSCDSNTRRRYSDRGEESDTGGCQCKHAQRDDKHQHKRQGDPRGVHARSIPSARPDHPPIHSSVPPGQPQHKHVRQPIQVEHWRGGAISARREHDARPANRHPCTTRVQALLTVHFVATTNKRTLAQRVQPRSRRSQRR